MNFTIFADMKAYINTIILLIFLFASATPLAAQEIASPRKSEGIDAFLRRHGRTTPEAKAQFLKLNKERFSKDGGLRMDQSYILPDPGANTQLQDNAAVASSASVTSNKSTETTATSTSKCSQRTITEPLFGKSLKNVAIKSQELAGACFYLVSGHGGPDPGAVSKVGGVTLHEDEYAYDITLRLARN